MPAFRQVSSTETPSSACRRIKAICCSLNFDLFIGPIPSPSVASRPNLPRFAHSKRSRFQGSGQSEGSAPGLSVHAGACSPFWRRSSQFLKSFSASPSKEREAPPPDRECCERAPHRRLRALA